jgi:Carboxypeptidase regulatory-like domain
MRVGACTVFLALALVLTEGAGAYGQAGSGDITGEVRDGSGGLLAGATLVLTRAETEERSRTVSSDGGVYRFAGLKPGTYSVSAEAAGFKKLVREGIVVSTGNTARVDLSLALGQASEVVTVREDASPLKTESATLGQTIDVREIPGLPLNGRTFVNLIALAPGVAVPPGSSLPRLSGSRPRTNEYQYDGIAVLQPEPGQVAYFPIVDAIQEFNVATNSAPAEFGRFNGGVINLTTKSGSNAYHGSLFEFLRNEKLNARNLFAPATPANPNKPEFRRNQFGFVAGGPIVRERTFFFVDYQGTRQLLGKVVASTVPTLDERNHGDFSKLLGLPLFRDPGNNNAVTTSPSDANGNPNTPVTATDTNGNRVPVRQNMIFRPSDHLAYAGNAIPVDTFDAIAKALLDYYPLPTSTAQANNFRRIANEPDQQDQFDVRLDHRFSSRDQVFGRYSYFKDFTSPVTAFANGGGTVAAGASATGPQDTLAQSVVGNYQHTISPLLWNELRFGYTRRHVERAALLLSSPPSESLNLPGIPGNGAFNDEFPTFLVAGFQQLGPPANTDSSFRTDVTEIADTAAWQHGRHTIKFGVDNRISRLDVLQPPSPTGSFTFSPLFTNLVGVTGTGNALASFLLGQVQQFSIDLQQNALQPRAWFEEWFVADDWKLTSRLTLNAGTRYTLNFPSTEAHDRGAVFNLATEQLQYLGKDGFPHSARELHGKDFGPRLGLSYLWTKKTVIRSGYGLTFFDQAGITTPFTIPQFPFVQTASEATLDNLKPAFLLSRGPTVGPVDPTPEAGLGQGVFSVDRKLGSGYVQQWNLAVEREITPSLSFEVAYAGSKATHLGVPDVNLNQLTVNQLAAGSALTQTVANPYFGELPPSSSIGGPTIAEAQLRKPFPRFTNVTLFRNNVGNSDYHAVQAKLEKRFSRGLTFLASYTRSKLIDDASSVFDASIFTGPIASFPVADSFNRRLEQDVSTGDIPNYFVVSWVYELPVGPGHKLHPSGVLGRFTNGWQISGIVTVESGIPLALTQTTNFNAFAGFGTQRPNCLGDPTPDHRTTAVYFDAAAFAIAPQFTLGSCSRNPVRGPGYQDADLAFIKRTNLTERFTVDFRTEIFNLTNTPPLNAPNVVFGSAAFGTITSAGDPRVIQLALKLNF